MPPSAKGETERCIATAGQRSPADEGSSTRVSRLGNALPGLKQRRDSPGPLSLADDRPSTTAVWITGKVAAGASDSTIACIGRLTKIEAGNLTFAFDDSYRAYADAAEHADRIHDVVATGTATIRGGTVNVLAGSMPSDWLAMESPTSITRHVTLWATSTAVTSACSWALKKMRPASARAGTARLCSTVGWRHRSATSTNALQSGSSFTVAGVPLARNVAVVELGLATQLQRNVTLSASYAGQMGNGLRDHGLKIALGWEF